MDKIEHDSSIWSPSFLVINILFFLFFTNISLFYLYPLALRQMGLTDSSIGAIMGIFSVATVISRPFMGKLILRKGVYFVISLSMLITVIASVSYPLGIYSHAIIYMVRATHGIGFSAFISATFSLVAVDIPYNKQAEAYAMVGASLMAAIAVIPPLGEVLLQRYGFNYLYFAASLIIILAWGTLWFLPRPHASASREQATIEVSYPQLLKSASFVCVLASTLVFAHCQSTMLNFLALLAERAGTHSGKFFFFTYLVAIVVLMSIGKSIDRHGKRLFLRLFYPLLPAGMLLIPVLINHSLFFLPACFMGLAMGCLFPVLNALAAAHGKTGEKPAVMSLFTATYDTGFITGAFLSGLTAQISGIENLFIITGLLAVAGAIFVLFAPIKDREKGSILQ